MKIVQFVKSSLVEWTGRISSTMFVGGCNLRCPFCFNSELVTDYKNLKEIPFSNILTYLDEVNTYFNSGVTGFVVSGGEPLLYQDTLVKLLDQLNQHCPMDVRVDSNFTLKLKSDFLKRVDYFAPSYKIGMLNTEMKTIFSENCRIAKEKLSEIRLVITGQTELSEVLDSVNFIGNHLKYRIIRAQGWNLLGKSTPPTSSQFSTVVQAITTTFPKLNYIVQE